GGDRGGAGKAARIARRSSESDLGALQRVLEPALADAGLELGRSPDPAHGAPASDGRALVCRARCREALAQRAGRARAPAAAAVAATAVVAARGSTPVEPARRSTAPAVLESSDPV